MSSMPSRPLLIIGRLVCLPILFLPSACEDVARPGEDEGDEPPLDLVIITIDTLRADHLGCYGYFRDTSPNLDLLARESLVFDDFQSPVAQTLPGHTTLFTGLSPREHGIESNISMMNGSYIPSPHIQTLASHLAEHGYHTAGFVSATPVMKGTGAETGFQHWWQPEEIQVRGDVTTDRVIAWLESDPPSPWFLWIHQFDPHWTYDPPSDFDIFSEDTKTEPQKLYLEQRDIPEGVPGKPPKVHDVAAFHALYDGEVRFVDHQLGRFIAALRRMGRWERTALVVTSDHGEGLWQHGVRDHASLWTEQLAVPLLIRIPGIEPARNSQRMTGRDLLPTLFPLLPGISGEELLAQSTGVDVLSDAFRPPPRYSQVPPMPLMEGRGQPGPQLVEAIEHAGWRLLRDDQGQLQLFHLETDPYELNDLAADEPERLRDLQALLDRELAKQLARREELGAGKVGPMTSERLEQLRALGYGGDGSDDE